MVNLQPVGAAADHAGLVALVDEGSEPAPVPTAPDPSSLFPGTLPVPFPFAFGASAGRVEDVVAAGAEIAEGAQGVLQGVILALTGANVARIEPLLELGGVDADRGSRAGADLDGRQLPGGDLVAHRALRLLQVTGDFRDSQKLGFFEQIHLCAKFSLL
jgi:hypothetical protein